MPSRLRSILQSARSGAVAPRPPLVVLAIGGSGTRAIAEVMRASGIYLGPTLNKATDSMELKPFLVRWSTEYLIQSGWIEALEADPNAEIPDPPKEVVADLRHALKRLREGIPAPETPWGWKNPRTTNLVPALMAVEPDAITAQLVRDGRDIAYSKNQNVIGDAGHLTPEHLRDASAPIRQIELWSRVNLANLAYMRRLRGDAHLVIRYEDLCADPAAWVDRLFTHFGLEASDAMLEQARETIKLAPTTGRWRDAPADEVDALLEAGGPALREFGYV